ncbi:PAS domain-containing protein [Pseudoroseomonas wenyumeiae]|uniref:histidine kinase n=1 Tax=Teichococcus wenyumeiae TaxID=2478470 RepID=A0A3A9JXJ1_9PROT|nr:PAS-domain containing protein [Pseudoroseomonas wenyumeiae]RKK03779.1 PAS domain-containing protein [Pseudoroseomonas wenyumeiae]RMI20456.1 PAS domain-containing protein [Pseudoroseomonas wenyumeiae]
MPGAMEQAQAALQLVLAMPGAVVVYDARGQVLLANAAAVAMLNLPPEASLSGMSAADVTRGLAARGFFGPGEQEAQVRRMLEIDPASSHRRLLCATDGRWFELAHLPLPDGRRATVTTDITQYRQAEIAAWERLRLADAALRQNPSGIGIYDHERRLVLHNDAYEILLNLPPGSLRIGMSFDEVTDSVVSDMAEDPEGRAGFETRRHLDRGQRLQFLHLRPNGLAVRAISQPLSNGGFLVVLEDVTPLHAAEEEAKRRADLLDAVLAALPHSVCVYGPDSRLRMVNAACRRIFKDDDVAIGDHLLDTLRRREDAGIFMDRRDPEETFRRRFNYGRPPVIRMCADGTVLTGITAPLPDGGHISVISDITALHRAEFEAQRRAGLLQVMMDNMRHGICLFDRDCRVVAVNPLACALTGLSEQEMAPGASLEDLRRLQLERGQFGAGQAGVEVFRWRAQRVAPNLESYTRVTADGRCIEVSTDPTPDGGFVRIYSDVTAERQALAEIERARIAAEEASCAKTRFLATMSHELRTPLNAVIGFSEALVDEVDPQNVEEFARTIMEAGRHLLSLIDEVLAVAQAGAGALQMELRPLYMPTILESALRLMRPAAEAAEVSLSLEPLPNLPRARADERRLRQILLNLIANALKFTPAGGSVTLGASLPQPGVLEITVSDTGIGIAADQLERAFEPFVQLETSHARRYGGSGLGLYLARALAQAMEATLVLDSERGSGTVARLRLKVAEP